MRQAGFAPFGLWSPNLIGIIYEISLLSAQETHCILRSKSDTVMLFRKIFDAFYQSHTCKCTVYKVQNSVI